MLSLIQGLLFLTTATAMIGPGTLSPKPAMTPTNAHPGYTQNQVEYYLTADETDYIRPGFNITVQNVIIDADRKLEATLAFTDDKGQPLDRLGNVTPGALSISFIVAWYDGTARQYTDYFTNSVTSPITGVTASQATGENNGTWTDLALGQGKYVSKRTLPAGYDATKTHTMAIYATRNLTSILGKNYYANVEYDFRPDGGTVTEKWAAIALATCNNCHTDLGLHGGSRKDPKLCVTCHNPQTTDPDTGNTVDMKVFIHKIHDGENLPSVQAGTPYQIIGYQQSLNDYSTVAYPQDIRNCTSCHKPDAPEGDIWMTRPNRAACGSCHDDVNWTTGENHPAGPEADDSACASCHAPQGESEFDASVTGAHTIELKSTQLKGLNMAILNVTGAVAGGTPTVTFKVTENDGTVVAPSSLATCSLLIGGPTVDYAGSMRESAKNATVNADGSATYTFTGTLPSDASGSWTVSADVYRNVTIDNGTTDGYALRECAFNPIYYVALTPGGTVVPRRDVVSMDKCNVCHDTLALHGGQRMNVKECLICHNALADDTAQRPADQLPAESIHFKRMIHRIHTGENLAEDYTVYGHGGSENNYNEVRFPGDRRACEICHLPGTYGVPLPDGVLDTPTPRDYYSPMKPTAAACLACHSELSDAAHAYTMTAPFGEACDACHGSDAEFSVAKVHAR